MSRFRRRKFDECIELCDELLANNPRDEAAWTLKCRSITRKNFIDDLEIDEANIGDILLDDNQVNQVAREGTSFNRPATNRQGTANPVTIELIRFLGRFQKQVVQHQECTEQVLDLVLLKARR